MATYTDNYTMTKPTYAEQADISVINANMDIIDNVMHSSQISLAPAYDQNETYNTGDKVQFELLMYKCKEDGVTGAWDSTKWQRTTASEGGSNMDIYGEASGTAEASFSDGAEASLVECEIGIEPTQDLHGYSKPWAGGAGKNKCPITTMSTTNGGYINLSTGIIGSVVAGQTYTLSLKNETPKASNLVVRMLVNGSWVNLAEGNLVANEVKTYTFTPTSNGDVSLSVYLGTDYSPAFSKLQLELGSTATTFEPYSNICPITGHTDVTVTVASTSGGSGDDTTVSLGRTVYGGTLDVTTGELTVTWDNIPSYAGETLTGEWLSSMDEYDALGTPTTGAQVAYELATPQTFTLTKEQIQTLLGQNYVSHDGGGTISLVYIKKDSTIVPNPSDAEVPLTGLEISGKGFKITDARIPAPPTTNGAYVLTVTVSGGTPTYSWENA